MLLIEGGSTLNAYLDHDTRRALRLTSPGVRDCLDALIQRVTLHGFPPAAIATGRNSSFIRPRALSWVFTKAAISKTNARKYGAAVAEHYWLARGPHNTIVELRIEIIDELKARAWRGALSAVLSSSRLLHLRDLHLINVTDHHNGLAALLRPVQQTLECLTIMRPSNISRHQGARQKWRSLLAPLTRLKSLTIYFNHCFSHRLMEETILAVDSLDSHVRSFSFCCYESWMSKMAIGVVTDHGFSPTLRTSCGMIIWERVRA